ncbi:MAG TPA: DUF397 domain-containing protein [Pseudonocardiaceae bacterium]|jgi:hypothetical protein|nr:DUF397 domain-containing protein [Pseudonocardiaceae bacterium]
MSSAARDTGWFKSSRSASNGENCVEVRIAEADWFKSSYSGGNDENCVEVRIDRLAVGVRDSKSRDAGQFVFDAPAWQAFLANAKAGRFDA